MQTELFPSYVLTEYEVSFMFSPSFCINQYIKRQKNLTGAMIGDFKSKFYPAHISIGKYRVQEKHLDELMEFARNSLTGISPFNIFFDGYGKFDNTNTIFVNISNQEELQPIFKSLFGDYKYKPHMTIAEALSNKQFYYAWKHFKNKVYHDQFLCDHILVLRKEVGSKGKWEQYERIPLGKNSVNS